MVRTKELDQFSNAAWSVGVRRESVIAPLAKRSRATQAEIECAATKLGLGTAMVFRLVARYRRERNTSVLAPERPGRKRGSHVLGLKLERIIRDSIGNFYLRPEKPSVAALHREIMAVSNMAGITAPCYGTVLQRVNEFDQRALMKGRVGAREAARRFTPVKGGLNVDELLGLVQIDHTLVDVIVVDEIDREPIGRPWITLAVDVATRMVLGFCLGLEAPDVTSVALTLSMAVLPKTRFLATQQLDLDWPCHGLPKRVHLDNAREFRANSLKRGCQEYGIEIVFRPPGKPHYGGHIERLIGTLMGEVHLLPGTTFSSVAQRGRYKAERAAVMTMRELETWLTLQIAGVYHMSHHRGLGKSPRQAWSEATQSCPPIRLPQNEQQFYIDFLPYQRRTIRRDGIRMFNIFYWAESLTTLLHHADRDYAVHYDRRDLSRVFVRDRQGRIIEVPYRTRSYIPVTLEEQRWAVQKLRSANATVSEKGLFDAIEKRRLIVKSARKKTMRTRRSSQKTAYALQPSNRQPATRIVESSTEASGPIEPYPVEIWE